MSNKANMNNNVTHIAANPAGRFLPTFSFDMTSLSFPVVCPYNPNGMVRIREKPGS